jgi:hypothetical protein
MIWEYVAFINVEGIGEVVVVAYFKIVSRRSPGRTEEDTNDLRWDRLCPGRGLNSECPEYKSGVLHRGPSCSVWID